MPFKQKDYFTTHETASTLKVAVSTIQLWTDNGGTMVAGYRRTDKNSIEPE